jgi:intracellular multiplication protein IcmG
MDTLAAAVVSIQDEMQKAREKEQAQKKATQKVIKIPIYHVRAIVPNRAWLESDDGNTVTVKVGDRIYGYGKVELISPKQGMVVTSSGAIIQYGENDS